MGRPRKDGGTNTAPSTTPKKTTTTPSTREKQLESEVKELKDIVKQMQDMILSQKQPVEKPVVSYEQSDFMAPQGETVDVPFRQYVKVMSLTRHRLTLSTEGFGNGTVFNFTEYGQVQSIIYEDLAKIIHNNPRFTKEGYYFIMDPRVLKIHNLEDDYKKIIDRKTMDNILELDSDKIRSLLKNASTHIKNTIASIVVDKILAGESVDLNKARVISVESEKDIDNIVKTIIESKKPNEED